MMAHHCNQLRRRQTLISLQALSRTVNRFPPTSRQLFAQIYIYSCILICTYTYIYVYAHLYIQTHIYGTQTSSCQLWQLWSSIKAHSGGRQTIDPKEADIAESVGLELIDHGLKDLWGYRRGAPSVERVCKFLTAAKQTLHINSNCF